MEPDSAIEALLLISREPISLARFCDVLALESGVVQAGLDRVMARYANRGICVAYAPEGYRFVAAPQCADVVQAYREEPRALSDEAQDVLAIVAYLQPVTFEQVADRRDGDPTHVLETLVEAGMILGPPYVTTDRFLEASGLQSLDELPLVDFEDESDDWALAA